MNEKELESQIAAIQRWEPEVHALVDWDEPTARQRWRATADGQLNGWSVAVKDIIDLAEVPTGCNADFVPAEPAPRDAAVVAALLSHGAFVMSKSVTTTFAYADPGPTRNPWHLDHTPGGSSSGSAAAVASGMARIALGSQTVGSVNRPASFCGVVGFKPTFGRLPIEGVFPFAPSVDTVGVFATNVRDVQTVFLSLTDEAVKEARPSLRIAFVQDMRCDPPETSMSQALQAASGQLSDAGHDVSDLALPASISDAYENHWTLVAAECAQSHTDLFQQYGKAYTPKLRDIIERGRQVEESQIERIQEHRRRTIEEIDKLFDTYDVLLTPSAVGSAPRGLDSTGEPRMNLPWTYVGCPTLTLPMNLDAHGLPLGLQLVGRRMHDQALLAAGAIVERILAFTARPSLANSY